MGSGDLNQSHETPMGRVTVITWPVKVDDKQCNDYFC